MKRVASILHCPACWEDVVELKHCKLNNGHSIGMAKRAMKNYVYEFVQKKKKIVLTDGFLTDRNDAKKVVVCGNVYRI